MIMWTFALLLASLSLKLFLPDLSQVFDWRDEKRQLQTLNQTRRTLLDLQELLEAGIAIPDTKWVELEQLPEPWSPLIPLSLKELRQTGAALLPVTLRFRDLVETEKSFLLKARTESAQARAQGWVILAIVPILGVTLPILLPSLQESLELWTLGCLIAISIAFLGCIWIRNQVSDARWGNTPSQDRKIILSVQCAGERLMALIHSGLPPDIAWQKTIQIFNESNRFQQIWGSSIWASATPQSSSLVLQKIQESTHQMRLSIQVSLMEGRSSLERIDSNLDALRKEIQNEIQTRVTQLGTQVLKPLFVFVAPSVLSLMALAIWITWQQHI